MCGDELYVDDEQETEADEEKAVRFLRETKASAFDSFPAPSFWKHTNSLTRIQLLKKYISHQFTRHSHVHINIHIRNNIQMCDVNTCTGPDGHAITSSCLRFENFLRRESVRGQWRQRVGGHVRADAVVEATAQGSRWWVGVRG